MDRNNRILIYVDSINRAKFFYEFNNFFETVYITNKLSVFLYLKNRVNIKLIKKSNKKLDIDFSNSLSVLNSYHSIEDAKKIGGSVVDLLYKLGKFDYCFIWNGTTTIERALTYFAKSNKIKTLYFEISNIENRVFIDKKGIAGESFLFKHPEILDKFEVDYEKFYKWRENYLKSKDNVKNTLKNEIPWYVVIDMIGYILGVVKEDKRNKFKLFLNRLKNKKNNLKTNIPDYTKKYILVPLQVSNDSQVKIYSRFNNEDLIKKAIEIAKNDEYIYIKPHPQEENLEEIEKIKSFLNDKIILVNDNVFKLIKNASKVIVNTSTIGLESKILEKDTIVLGDAYYKNFDFKRVVSYIQNYLSNIKYPNCKLSDEDIKFLNRIENV